jgi:5-formyltetrahydrofolate cyclo-ligase
LSTTAVQLSEAAPDPVAARKRQLRVEAVARRRSWAGPEEHARASLAARDRLLAEVPLPAGAAVSGFWPMAEEIDTRPALLALAERGHVIGLPIVVKAGLPLVFRRWRPGDTLVEGGFGVMIPSPDKEEVVPDVALTPLLAFDRRGYRLGYGGGFYDRTLAKLRATRGVLAVGFAFAAQQVEALPTDAYDQPLDWLATDRFVWQLPRR